MPVTLYQATVPTFLQHLQALSGVLDKATAFAAQRKIEESVLLNLRLSPDMFPLVRQVRAATSHAAGAGRLAGVELPKFADNEASFADLKQRIATTVDFLKGLKPSQIDGTEDKELTLTFGQNSRSFKGLGYILHFAMPNFYFHTTCAYAILRQAGAEIGKRDFMGTPPQ